MRKPNRLKRPARLGILGAGEDALHFGAGDGTGGAGRTKRQAPGRRPGDSHRRAAAGGGNITGATGKLLSEIWDQEDIIVADVLPARVAAMRAKNPWDRGQRHDLYHQAIVWT
jgi:predicted amidohydrolase